MSFCSSCTNWLAVFKFNSMAQILELLLLLLLQLPLVKLSCAS